MPRLIRVFAGWTCHFVGFIMRRLKCRNLHVFIFGECHVLLQLVHTKICDTLVQKLILKIQVKCKKTQTIHSYIIKGNIALILVNIVPHWGIYRRSLASNEGYQCNNSFIIQPYSIYK